MEIYLTIVSIFINELIDTYMFLSYLKKDVCMYVYIYIFHLFFLGIYNNFCILKIFTNCILDLYNVANTTEENSTVCTRTHVKIKRIICIFT